MADEEQKLQSGDDEGFSSSSTLSTLTKEMPKVELHAHLNGSIEKSTLKKLAEKKGKTWTDSNTCTTLEDCFKQFRMVHQLVTDQESVYQCTLSVIEDFASENVQLLELRTTPRDTGLMTREVYLETVLRAIEDWSKTHERPLVRLLVSLDRAGSVEAAGINMSLSEKHRASHPDLVVGLDLSGNPSRGSVQHLQALVQLLLRGRQSGLYVSVHMAEVAPLAELESHVLLEWGPDRVGHGVFLHKTTLWSKFCQQPVPAEHCLTSNLLSGTVKSLNEHHLKEFHRLQLPYAICTDDKGVFGTTLSREYELAADILEWTPEQLRAASTRAIDFSFLPTEDKKQLKEEFNHWWDQRMDQAEH